MTPPRNPDGSLGNFGRWPDPPRKRRHWPLVTLLLTLAAALGIVALPALAGAHHIDIVRDCDSVTIQSFSDGTMSILDQTGGVFAVGQTAPPGNPGLLTKTALPTQAGSVTVTWTTDSSHATESWTADAHCTATTVPTTAPPPTTEPPTTAPPTTAPPTTAPPTTAPPTTAPPTTAPPTTRPSPCDHKTPEDTLPAECFPPTTPVPTTVTVTTTVPCAEGFILITDANGNVHCTPTLIPPASVTSTPAVATSAQPKFTG
jgi:hypothetical protein